MPKKAISAIDLTGKCKEDKKTSTETRKQRGIYATFSKTL